MQYETSMLSLLDEQKTLYKTIEGLWLDANSAQQRYAATNEKLKSTQISYELISEQFNLGIKNTIELLTEKEQLATSTAGTASSQIYGYTEYAVAEVLSGRSISNLNKSIINE